VIRAGNRARAVLLTYFEIRYAIDKFHHEENAFAKRRNGQAVGEGVVATYYFMDDLLQNEKFNSPGGIIYRPADIPRISIHASDCLIDENIPLRYGLQSAFDGDPATSYVENTEDDLMEIEISVVPWGPGRNLNRLSLINGYAQSEQLYQANNRIGELLVATRDPDWETQNISTDNIALLMQHHTANIPDGILRRQYLLLNMRGIVAPCFIIIKKIYNGGRYNDTCLAELDLELLPYGWLFGGEDDE
jgi:hypothetical protein